MNKENWEEEFEKKYWGAMFECGDYEKLVDDIRVLINSRIREELEGVSIGIEVLKNTSQSGEIKYRNGLWKAEAYKEAYSNSLDIINNRLKELGDAEMKEIKFQGIDENNKIHPLCGLNWETMAGCITGKESHLGWCKFKDFRQFTGLKDKNGKEIYEGDIIEHEPHWDDNRSMSKVGKFGISPFHVGDYSVSSDDCKVIGNIYENPELIKKGE